MYIYIDEQLVSNLGNNRFERCLHYNWKLVINFMLSTPTLTRAFFVYTHVPVNVSLMLTDILSHIFIEIIEHFIQKLTYRDK